MKIKELKALIEKEIGWENFEGLVTGMGGWEEETATEVDEDVFKERIGLEFKNIEDKRSSDGDHDAWAYIFQIGDKFYQLDGSYDSNNGIDFYGVDQFFEVEPAEKVVKYYKPVKGAK